MNRIPMIETSGGEVMPAMIVGTFQHTDFNHLKTIVQKSIEYGFTGFDTAHDYGNEADLGQIVKESMHEFSLEREDFFLADKIDIWQMAETNGDISQKVDEALQKLKTDYIDLLFIHWPMPGYFEKTWETFIKVYEQGKAKAIGVSNVRLRHLTQLVESTGFKPHVIQNERHPLRTDTEVLDFAKSNGIVFQAYSPVCRMMEQITNSEVLKNVAQNHGKTIGQVILRWHIQTGSMPVFMTKKAHRLEEYRSVFDFELTREETESICFLDINYKLTPESVICPGF